MTCPRSLDLWDGGTGSRCSSPVLPAATRLPGRPGRGCIEGREHRNRKHKLGQDSREQLREGSQGSSEGERLTLDASCPLCRGVVWDKSVLNWPPPNRNSLLRKRNSARWLSAFVCLSQRGKEGNTERKAPKGRSTRSGPRLHGGQVRNAPWNLFPALNVTSWKSFFKSHSIQPFEINISLLMGNVPFTLAKELGSPAVPAFSWTAAPGLGCKPREACRWGGRRSRLSRSLALG